MNIAIAIYLGSSVVFAIVVAVLIHSDRAPKWLLDKDPHEKYDEQE